jgi:nitrogen fixation NifU-like protein
MIELYQQTLMDHYRNPRHQGRIENPTFSSRVDNPLCGDSLQITGIVTDAVLTHIGFQGAGCVISQAAASLLLQHVISKSVSDIQTITVDELVGLLGIQLGPVRLKCALMALEAVHMGISMSTE